MKGLLLALLYIAALILTSSCAHYQQAIFADSATTLVALKQGGAKELNPLFSDASPEVAAVGGAVLSELVVEFAKEGLPVDQCESYLRAFTSLKYGISANNLAVIAGASGAAPLLLGIGVGVGLYTSDVIGSQCD